jgi:hypothetical protein
VIDKVGGEGEVELVGGFELPATLYLNCLHRLELGHSLSSLLTFFFFSFLSFDNCIFLFCVFCICCNFGSIYDFNLYLNCNLFSKILFKGQPIGQVPK